ncbi:hypothetical protein M4V62_17735 [Streptomyces durmitorensis]|uniref:Uncharacterized protein n=1 Tax=Streptomyces durmitorensis TaxID=319947 RepID=A0ABY4PUN9_9ACTN|nr:hypothetical protein [Streptomyces durmitorensis]UQT56787.1 hypothetical protein M4V62_17735 [Streptomyces durmitorensis]
MHWNTETQRWEPGVDPSVEPVPPRNPDGRGASGVPGAPRAPGERFPGYGPPSGRPRRRHLAVVVVVGALVACGLGGSWLVWGRDDGGNGRADGRPAVSASAPTSGPGDRASASAPTPLPGNRASPVPEGYEMRKDPKGFATAVPRGWVRSTEGVQVYYHSPDGSSWLQVSTPSGLEMTPYEALRRTSEALKGGDDPLPGYRQDKLVEFNDITSMLSFTYDSPDDRERRRVMDWAFMTENAGPQYAVLVDGPADEWPLQQSRSKIALDCFLPRPGR